MSFAVGAVSKTTRFLHNAEQIRISLLLLNKSIGWTNATLNNAWRFIMHNAKEYVARAWLLEDLRQHLTTDELDEVILFAREAGYLDADAQLTEAGERYFRLMSQGKGQLVPA
jgi:hypothetical protein